MKQIDVRGQVFRIRIERQSCRGQTPTREHREWRSTHLWLNSTAAEITFWELREAVTRSFCAVSALGGI